MAEQEHEVTTDTPNTPSQAWKMEVDVINRDPKNLNDHLQVGCFYNFFILFCIYDWIKSNAISNKLVITCLEFITYTLVEQKNNDGQLTMSTTINCKRSATS